MQYNVKTKVPYGRLCLNKEHLDCLSDNISKYSNNNMDNIADSLFQDTKKVEFRCFEYFGKHGFREIIIM